MRRRGEETISIKRKRKQQPNLLAATAETNKTDINNENQCAERRFKVYKKGGKRRRRIKQKQEENRFLCLLHFRNERNVRHNVCQEPNALVISRSFLGTAVHWHDDRGESM